MKNFKKITSFVLVLLMILPLVVLSGCHRRVSKVSFDIPESFDTEKTYEITFWAKNENNANQRAIYKMAVESFEELYPNIKVTLRNFTDYGDIYNNVITNISTNTTPNVCITYPDHIATYIEGENVVAPLEALISDEKYGLGGSELRFDSPTADEIIPQFLSEGQIGGVQYALPFMRSTEACYVNRDFVEALGFTLPETLTWDFVWEVSEAAVALGKKTVINAQGKEEEVWVANGQKTFIPFIYKSTDNMMISMLRQLGAPYSDENANIDIFNDTTKGLLYEISEHTKSGAFSTFSVSGYPGNFLNQGQCIFAIDSTAGSAWMGTDAPLIDVPEDKLAHFDTVVMEIPQYDTENPKMISQGPSLCIFNKEDTGEVLASWLFAQYLLTNEMQIAYAQTEGYIPVTSKTQNSAEYQDYLSRAGEDNELYYSVKIEASKLLIENTENTFTAPVFNGSMSLRNVAGELIEDVVKSTRRKKTIDEKYFSELFARMTSLYKLDQIEGASGVKKELGALPTESVMLLSALGVTWLGIISYYAFHDIKKRKSKQKF